MKRKKRSISEWAIRIMDQLDDLARWANGSVLGVRPFAEIRRFIQRGLNGYDETCYWSVDDWLCNIVPPVLEQLAEKSHGAPGSLAAKYDDEKAAVVWSSMIRQMAAGFRAHKELQNADWSNAELVGRLQRIREDGMQLFVKWFGNLWD